MATEEKKETISATPSPTVSGGSNLDPKVGGLLAYLFGFVSGIILYLISKDSYIRFHALQSTILSIFVSVLLAIISIIPVIQLLTPIVSLAYFILWIFMMVKAYQGEKYKLPVIGDIAAERS